MGNGYYELPGSATNYASVPDIAAYDPSTSMRVDARMALDDWSRAADEQAIAGQWINPALEWLLRLENDGTVQMFYDGSPAKATSSAAVSFANGATGWVRCDVTFGSGTGVITFYESSTDTLNPDSASWSQISTHTSLTVTAIAHSKDLQIGAQNTTADPLDGKLHRLRMQIDGATQLDIDFTTITAAECTAGSFTEDSVNAATVTLTNGTCQADTPAGSGGNAGDMANMLTLGAPL